MTHNLKLFTDEYKLIHSGEKKCVILLENRPHVVNDEISAREFNPALGDFTGSRCKLIITHVQHTPYYGLKKGYTLVSFWKV